jgi:hypothetical protein
MNDVCVTVLGVLNCLYMYLHCGYLRDSVFSIVMLLAGVTPLHFAVSHKEVAAVRYFLEKGADPNIKDSSNGTTSLHEAAGLGNYCCTFYSVVNDY